MGFADADFSGTGEDIMMRCFKEYFEFDVWLTVHRNSVWIRKTN